MKKIKVTKIEKAKTQTENNNTYIKNDKTVDFKEQLMDLAAEIGNYVHLRYQLLIHPKHRMNDSKYFCHVCRIWWEAENKQSEVIKLQQEFDRIKSLSDAGFIAEFMDDLFGYVYEEDTSYYDFDSSFQHPQFSA